MNKIYPAALLAAITLVSGGCTTEGSSSPIADRAVIERKGESRAYLHSYNLPSHGVALEGYCPVAYFAVNKPVCGKPEHASTHEGVSYYFASAEAKQAFDAAPERYLPAYGGWCALGMAVEDKFPVDPESFKIVDGRLLLFLKNEGVDALELWNRGDEQELLRKADVYWKKAQG